MGISGRRRPCSQSCSFRGDLLELVSFRMGQILLLVLCVLVREEDLLQKPVVPNSAIRPWAQWPNSNTVARHDAERAGEIRLGLDQR